VSPYTEMGPCLGGRLCSGRSISTWKKRSPTKVAPAACFGELAVQGKSRELPPWGEHAQQLTMIRKTEVAIEICRRRLHQGRGPVVWLDGRSLITFEESRARFQTAFSLDPVSGFPAFFHEHAGLLVLDDIVEEKALEGIVHALGPGFRTSRWSLLATSQNSSFVGSSVLEHGIHVPLFEPATACSLLTLGLIPRGLGWSKEDRHVIADGMDKCFEAAEEERTPATDSVRKALEKDYGIKSYSQLVDLVEALGRLPIAITQCSAYMREYGISAANYLQKYGALSRMIRLDLFGRERRGKDVLGSFKLTLERLEDSDPTTARLLTLFSFLDRNSVSLELLDAALLDSTIWDGIVTFRLDADLRAAFRYLDQSLPDYDKSLGALESLCLVSRDIQKQLVTVHSQVHESIHLRMRRGTVVNWLQQVVRLLVHRLPPLLYSFKDSESPVMQALVLRHADRLREMVLLYEEDLGEIHADVACFFLECFLWNCGERFLACGEKLATMVPRPDRTWVGSLFATAKVLHEIQRFQSGYLVHPRFAPQDIFESVNLTARARPPLNSRHALSNAFLYYRLSSLVERRDWEDQIYDTYGVIESTIFTAYDELWARHSPSASGMTMVRVGLGSSAAASLSLQRRISDAILIQEAANALMAHRRRNRGRSPASGPQYAPKTRTMTILIHLDGSCKAAEEALTLGVAELREYFSAALSVIHAEGKGNLDGQLVQLAQRLLAATIRSNRSAVHQLAQASWPTIEAYQSVLLPYRSDRHTDQSTSSALDLLLEEPLLAAKAYRQGYDLPPRSWFLHGVPERNWLERMLGAIDGRTWQDGDETGGLRRAALEYGRRLGSTLPPADMQTFFRTRLSTCLDSQPGLWEPAHEVDWAEAYFGQLSDPKEIIKLCEDIRARVWEDDVSGQWAQRLFDSALESGNVTYATQVADEAQKGITSRAAANPTADETENLYLERAVWTRKQMKFLSPDELFPLIERCVAEWAALFTQAHQNDRVYIRGRASEVMVEWGIMYLHHMEEHGVQDEDVKKGQFCRLYHRIKEPLFGANCQDWPVCRRWLSSFGKHGKAFQEEDARRAEERRKQAELEEEQQKRQAALEAEEHSRQAELEINSAPLTAESWTLESAAAIHSYTDVSIRIHRPGGDVGDDDLVKLGFSLADLRLVTEQGAAALQVSDSGTIRKLGVPIGRLLASDGLAVECQV